MRGVYKLESKATTGVKRHHELHNSDNDLQLCDDLAGKTLGTAIDNLLGRHKAITCDPCLMKSSALLDLIPDNEEPLPPTATKAAATVASSPCSTAAAPSVAAAAAAGVPEEEISVPSMFASFKPKAADVPAASKAKAKGKATAKAPSLHACGRAGRGGGRGGGLYSSTHLLIQGESEGKSQCW